MIEVKPLTDRAGLANLIARQPLQPFLQTWAWGDFQHAVGRPVWRLAAYDGDRLVGAALVMEHQLMLGKSYLYCPRGPIADHSAALKSLYGALRELGEKEEVMYLKIDPGQYNFPVDFKTVAPDYQLGTTLQPRHTVIIDVSVDPEKIMEGMHQKTRYNIRLAEKRGVTVRWSTAMEDFDKFLKLMHVTADRQNIRLHGDNYYRKLFTTLQAEQMAELVLGEYAGDVRAAHLIIWQSQTATYLHGGSDDAHREAMIPYLLQWETIKKCHQRGITKYDLWGVAPPDSPDHHWAGITRFKMGFNGQLLEFPSAMNAIIQPQWYMAYRLAKRMRGGVEE